MTAGRTFLDTNVLVYCFDRANPQKRERALAIVEGKASEIGDLVLSTQVLQEFFVTVIRKLARPLEESAAEAAVRELCTLPIVHVDTSMVLAAIGTSRRHRLSLWDSLILHAAVEGGCDLLLSEDLQDGFEFESLRIENPFKGL
jgi:predicted nucleic acid-binding protein